MIIRTMEAELTGRGFWDVVDNHMFEVGVMGVFGILAVRWMWHDWCVTKGIENIALAKLSQPRGPKDSKGSKGSIVVEEEDSDSETF